MVVSNFSNFVFVKTRILWNRGHEIPATMPYDLALLW